MTIYTIGLNLASGDAKRKLAGWPTRPAARASCSATPPGGRDLSPIQGAALALPIAYQSTNTSGGDDFRSVQLTVDRPGVKVKTISGYYP